MTLVAVDAESRVSAFLILQDFLKRHLLRQTIDLPRYIRRGPVHGALEFTHGVRWQLNFAVSGLAILQLLNIVRVDGEPVQIRKLWRAAEWLDCEIAGELSQLAKVARKFEVALRLRFYVNDPKHEDLISGRGVHHCCQSLA